jgi:ferredoxin
MCEGCVDICPWKCIHMLSTDTIAESLNTGAPGEDPDDHVVFLGAQVALWMMWQNRGRTKPAELPVSSYGRPLVKKA